MPEQEQQQPDGSDFKVDRGEPTTYLDEDTARMQAELLQDNPDFVRRTDDRLVRLGEQAALKGRIDELRPSYDQAHEEYEAGMHAAFGSNRDRFGQLHYVDKTGEGKEKFRTDIEPRTKPVLDEMKELGGKYEAENRRLRSERGYLYGMGTREMGLKDVEKKVVGPEAVWELFGELKTSNPELAAMPAAEYLEKAKKLLGLDYDITSLDRTVEESGRAVEWCKALKAGEKAGINEQSLGVLYDAASRGADVMYYDFDDSGKYVHERLSNRVRRVGSGKFDLKKEQDEFFASAHEKTIDELYDAMQVTAERVLQARQEEAAETRQKYEEAKRALLEWGNNPNNGQDQQAA